MKVGTLLVVFIAKATKSLSDTTAAADSTSEFPSRVPHRSSLEEAATIPGRIIYLPIQLVRYGIRWMATELWEQ